MSIKRILSHVHPTMEKSSSAYLSRGVNNSFLNLSFHSTSKTAKNTTVNPILTSAFILEYPKLGRCRSYAPNFRSRITIFLTSNLVIRYLPLRTRINQLTLSTMTTAIVTQITRFINDAGTYLHSTPTLVSTNLASRGTNYLSQAASKRLSAFCKLSSK